MHAPDQAATSRRYGTAVMIGGTAVSAIAVYVYQVISGRTLGNEEFAPIGVLWTVGFLVFTIAMLPLEQYVTRKLVLVGGAAEELRAGRTTVATVIGVSLVVGVGFVFVTLDRFFQGNAAFVLIMAMLVLARAVLAIGRGFLAGRRRFYAYGGALALEGVSLVVLAGIAAVTVASSVAFGMALALAPLSVLVFVPFRKQETLEPVADTEKEAASVFLGWYLVATGTSQMILAGGPIVVGFIGGTAADVSVFFITFTLFRGPITSSYNLLARVLPDFTELAASGDSHRLHVWSGRLFGAGVVLAVIGFVTAWAIGPEIITLLYGSEFEPPRLAAALGGAAVGAGLAALFSGQILVAFGRTDRLAVAWIIATVFAFLAVVLVDSDPVTRVAAGLAAGETTALIGLTALGARSR
jgi:O-antigen/teichoic acid export membrane protein